MDLDVLTDRERRLPVTMAEALTGLAVRDVLTENLAARLRSAVAARNASGRGAEA